MDLIEAIFIYLIIGVIAWLADRRLGRHDGRCGWRERAFFFLLIPVAFAFTEARKTEWVFPAANAIGLVFLAISYWRAVRRRSKARGDDAAAIAERNSAC